MSSRLPTHMYITAAIRHAADAGAVITVVHKGDADRGAVLIKINTLTGQFSLFQQAYDGEKTVFMNLLPPTDNEGMVNAEITRQRAFDSDMWVIEIEDRQGRLWLDQIFL